MDENLVGISGVVAGYILSAFFGFFISVANEGDTLTPTLHQQLRECEKGIENLINAIQMGILTSSTKERLEDLEKQRATLKLSLLQAQMERPKYSKEYIVSWISRFKYGNIHDQAYRKEIIDIFVNSVYLYDDHLVFTYNFKDGTQTLTLQEIESALCSDLTSSASPKRKTCNSKGSQVFSDCQKTSQTPPFLVQPKRSRNYPNANKKI